MKFRNKIYPAFLFPFSIYIGAYSDIRIKYCVQQYKESIFLFTKEVSHFNSRILNGEKQCSLTAIHALLMHGYATFNDSIPGP